MPRSQVVFSGIQPSGALHLGNYIGAIQQWIAQQESAENLHCVVDLHALTVPEQSGGPDLRERSRNTAALFFAAGLDPAKVTVFIQSTVPEHVALAWLLACTTPLMWLEKMSQFKYKSQRRSAESIGTGLLTYPVLQAADIVLYDTNVVPVGEDQLQHIELARDVVRRFNSQFGQTFVEPEAVLPAAGSRVMGFDDPTRKMSKADQAGSQRHSIGLLDDPGTIRKTVMSAVTDSGGSVSFSDGSPGIRNLLVIYKALSGSSEASIESEFGAQPYGFLKQRLAELIIETLSPIRAAYEGYLADPAELDRILGSGTERARARAQPVITRAYEATGLAPWRHPLGS